MENFPLSQRNMILAVLATLAGYIDASTYVGLGHAFPANMTGNTVLLALAAARWEIPNVWNRTTALVGFLVGAAFSDWMAPFTSRTRHTPESFRRCLTVELAILFLFALGSFTWKPIILIVLSGIAMGLQSAAVNSLGIRGITTTYITGTYIRFIREIGLYILPNRKHLSFTRNRPGPALLGSVLVVYFIGCLLGGVAQAHLHQWAFIFPALLITAIRITAPKA